MRKLIRGIIFDFDATLGIGSLDKDKINREMFEVLRSRGLKLDLSTYLAVISRTLGESDKARMDTGLEPTFAEYYGKVLTSLGFEADDALIQEWQTRIWSDYNFQLYPTTVRTLEELTARHYLMAVVSNTINGTTVYNIRRTGIEQFFSIVVQSCDVGVRKPDKRIFQLALSHLGLQPGQCLAVGNSPYFDIMEPHNMGMTTVLMRTEVSYREPSDLGDNLLRDPDFAIDRLEQLTRILGC